MSELSRQIDIKYIVVDGYHRYFAAKKLGIEHILGNLKKYRGSFGTFTVLSFEPEEDAVAEDVQDEV